MSSNEKLSGTAMPPKLQQSFKNISTIYVHSNIVTIFGWVTTMAAKVQYIYIYIYIQGFIR